MTSPPAPPENPPADPGLSVRSAAVLTVIVGCAVVALRLEGRRWWCECGRWWPWSIGIHSRHTSQHFVDPYSLTHVLHGVIFYGVLWLVGRRVRWDLRLLLAILVECLWEIVENSSMVIDRYRRATIALGYEGDSVLNSLGDIVSCGVGFALARRLPTRWTLALALAVEVGLLLLYRDNLLLNVIMLVHPIDAIRQWQAGAAP